MWNTPPMRGRKSEPVRKYPEGRITPAHAGKSIDFRYIVGLHQDHPRACGEKLIWRQSKWLTTGSPPRMRGKALASYSAPTGIRITPAHAGKSRSIPSKSAMPWDHPRACGEKDGDLTRTTPTAGSPPRMRGKA